MNKYIMGLYLAINVPAIAWAQEIDVPDVPPTDTYELSGHYGMGGLDLWRSGKTLEGAIFNINAVSERGNVCELTGKIHNNRSILKVYDQSSCEINFSEDATRIRVANATSEACSNFCGSGAYFDGDYLKLPSECSEEAKKATDQLFLKQYQSKRYTQAIATLSKMWQTCEPTMHWLDEMKIRNNLAIAYAKSGDKVQCLKVLQPYQKEIQSKNPLELRDPPVSYLFIEDYQAQLKSARYNWKMCQ